MSRRSARASHVPALTAALLLAAPSLSAQDHAGHTTSSDSAAVAAVVQAYHDALAAADSTAALALLAEDAMILESGGVETRTEYRSHHLPGDMAFAAAVPRERGPIQVTVDGRIAWAVSTSSTTGSYRGRDIDSRGAELMVLSRESDGWRIRAIHWSSRSAR